MDEINMPKYDECNFRKKRRENEYIKNDNQKIKDEITIKNMDKIDNYQENINIENLINNNSNDSIINKYPDFKSFIQIYPKEDADIPSIKYYNYIFNIGSPFN